MKAGRAPSRWLEDDMPKSLSIEDLEAWVAKSPTDEELDSWAAGESWIAQMQALGIEPPPVPKSVASAYGLTEIAKLVYGAAMELGNLGADAATRIARRLARRNPMDEQPVADAIEELIAIGLMHRTRGVLVVRKRAA